MLDVDDTEATCLPYFTKVLVHTSTSASIQEVEIIEQVKTHLSVEPHVPESMPCDVDPYTFLSQVNQVENLVLSEHVQPNLTTESVLAVTRGMLLAQKCKNTELNFTPFSLSQSNRAKPHLDKISSFQHREKHKPI